MRVSLAVRLSACAFGQLQTRESAKVVVYQEQVEVFRALDVGYRVALAGAGLDVPSSELQHVADGLKQHLILLDVKNYRGARAHTSS